jgi:hypothetical protein
MGGDIFDKQRPDSDSVLQFANYMRIMEKENIPVYYVQGDHDYSTTPWPNAISQWPIHISEQVIGVGSNYTVAGLDYQSRAKLKDKLAEVPQADFLVTHQAWAEIQGIGHTEGSLADVKHVNFLLTGDYHVADHWLHERADGTKLIAYSPGSTCMQSINERPEKSFIEVCIDEEFGNFVFNRIPLITRPFYKFSITTNDELNAFCRHDFKSMAEYYSAATARYEAISKPLMRIQHLDSIPDAHGRISDATKDQFHLFIEPKHEVEEITINFEEAPDGAFETLLDACLTLSESEENYNDVRRLLLSRDRALELKEMREEFFNEGNQTGADGMVSTPTS